VVKWEKLEWQELERGWWRMMIQPGTSAVISDPYGENHFVASIFIDGTKVGDSSFRALDEAQYWAKRTLFEAFTAVSG
jgi:hypothetical protein